MSKIRPFKGYRVPKEMAARLAALPYDVMNSAEARVMAEGNPMSFLHISKPEIDLDPKVDLYSPIVYETAKKNLAMFVEKGWLVPDSKPNLYAYRQIMNGHAQVGLMACAAVDDYDEDKIKKHEKTRQDKEDDRARHTDITNLNSGPVFLTYKARENVDRLMGKIIARTPDVDFVATDGIAHTLWVIDDVREIEELVRLFAQIDTAYVADGHHRAKSGSRVREIRRSANPKHTGDEEYNYFMAVYFPHDQLAILPYNRVVKDLNGNTLETFMDKVREKFEITDTTEPSPSRSCEFSMYLSGRWYRLKAKKDSFPAADPVKSLDVSILQDNLLHPILGIEDPRTDKRIDFVGGIRGTGELEKRVNSGECAVAFSMYPTTVEQLMKIADEGQIMPPKSTWFEPKLRSGLVVHFLS